MIQPTKNFPVNGSKDRGLASPSIIIRMSAIRKLFAGAADNGPSWRPVSRAREAAADATEKNAENSAIAQSSERRDVWGAQQGLSLHPITGARSRRSRARPCNSAVAASASLGSASTVESDSSVGLPAEPQITHRFPERGLFFGFHGVTLHGG